ncbi:MAG: hypothetical protein M1814_005212 [Vezdaea aestivalis]|nr:MAG: hypothetical protein M1814_005212 [Vezdaea aestivalis]
MSIINFTFTQIRKPIESSSSKVPDSQPLTSTLYNVSFAVEAIGDADSVGHCGGDILSKGTGSRIFCQGLTWAWALLAATGRSNISDEYILRIEHAVRNGVSQTVLLHTAALSLSDHFSEFADTDAEDSGDGVPTWCQSAKRTLSNGDNLPSSKNGTNYCTALDGGPIKIPYIVTPIVQDWRGQIAEANGTRSGDPNADKYPFSSYGTG